MSVVKYEIVEHDGGWAYKVGATYSETYPTHDAASKAAHKAAHEQQLPGATTGITYEDEQGQGKGEIASGEDRPQAEVEE